MGKAIHRRQALAAFGAVGLSAVFTGCARDGGNNTAGMSTTSSSGAGTSATTGPSDVPGPVGGPVSSDQFDRAGSCALTPEQTEGPYYLDIDSVRSDIREGKEGTRLRLGIRVRDFTTCAPVANAAVDIWHCDALGTYSGFESASVGAGGAGGPGRPGEGGGRSRATDNTRYLRGTQITNASGIVEFTTVYPGWYRGRTVHIHAKVHVNNREVLTTQLFFDEDLTRTVYAQQPYASDTGRDTFNQNDGIFSDETILTVSKDGDGYLGLINFGVKSA